ncbi:MAG: putative transporter [Hydrocarboniphaga sp.]|uniref:efflux RND transporter permease subunit n=1 Tax=Hydrocarboniphaga sp. TaxID=2033016 RepID=UPI0026219E14|nr:MMPL family transporter [Hydrocarboniphaga sp.]MDB5972809.1 putative transporter [Hydrocarboniphaga sp.]
MTVNPDQIDDMPVVSRVQDFDARSGNILERVIFNHRVALMVVCALLTVMLGSEATRLTINASFEKMIPQSHEFIQNYQKEKNSLRGLGNSVRIVVENQTGDIYDPKYLSTLREINDKVFLIEGVDRSFMKSLWMPAVRWTEITEEGYSGGAVMPDGFDGSEKWIDELRHNVQRAGIVGSLVSNDQKSSMLFVPLLETDSKGAPLDYKAFRDSVEKIAVEFEPRGVKLHTIGFAKLAGDLITGLIEVLGYFAVAAVIVSLIIFAYTRCIRSTVIVIVCSLIAVVWQLGLMQMLGFVIDPFSVLVPFLIFAIGVSHGAQKMNGITQDVRLGTHRYVAARYTFRRLFLAGLTALLADAVGFAVLAVVDIPVIRDLAIEASIGVAVLIFTNLILLPVLLSYVGVSPGSAARGGRRTSGEHPVLSAFGHFTDPKVAVGVLAVTLLITVAGFVISQRLKVGDLDPGAPELRPDSPYNRQNAYITSHYQLSSDQFAVIVKAPPSGLLNFEALTEMDRLEELLRDLPGVQTTASAASQGRALTASGFEGSPKWITLNRDPFVISDALDHVYTSSPELINDDRSVAPIIAFLSDHKADTLERVVDTVQRFALEHSTPAHQFLLAAGNSGIDAATNIAVEKANHKMLFYVYAAVIVLCYITFRSWRAVVVAVVPLVVTSILAEALMVALGIGVKVATLPVIALGVGIGVDYSLYLLTVYLAYMRQGMSVRQAYTRSLMFTGKVVALIGVTLAAAVATWAWSPIKFQANMGVLLSFMFLWNMVGALVIVPALATFLLRPKAVGEHVKAATFDTGASSPKL